MLPQQVKMRDKAGVKGKRELLRAFRKIVQN